MPPSYRFVRDVTVPDDTEINAGNSFVKTWRVENNGDVPWANGFMLSHIDGRAMTANTHFALPVCAPGQQVEISIQMTAPDVAGTYFSDWRMRDASGEFFGEKLWTQIRAVPAAVPQPIDGTNNMIYMADVTIDDDQKMTPGTAFTKTWRIKNTGTLPWGAGYTLNFEKGTAMTANTRIPLPVCAPGQECEVSANLQAPQNPGKYFGDWNIQDPQGNTFGVLLWFRIEVVPEGRAVERAQTPKPTIQTKAPHFSQRDSRWRSTQLGHQGSPVTIGSWGCMLTCFAMTAGALGHTTTPVDLNRTMVSKGGFWKGYFTEWDALATIYNDIVFEGKEDQHPNIVTRIDLHLTRQIPVPVLVDQTPNTRYNDNDQHWVLVVARNGLNDYWIYDPIDLEKEPVSLMERYGRADGDLRSAIRSALFYRKA